MRLQELKKLSSRKIIILIIIIVFIVGAGMAFVLMKEKKKEPGIIDDVWGLFVSVNNKNYTFIRMGRPPPESPENIKWHVFNESHTISESGNFPTVSGDLGCVTSSNMTIIWLDEDNDGKVSEWDRIIILSPQMSLYSCRFVLTYSNTGGTFIDGTIN